MSRFKNLEVDPPPEPRPTGESERARDEQYYVAEADEARRNGYYENALRFFSRALEFDKTLILAWVGQIRMLVELQEYPEAVLWSTKALEMFRDNPELMAGKAQALGRQGDVPTALPLSDGALQKPGQSAYRWIVRGELMVATRQQTDAYLFQKAVLADPDWLVPLEIARVFLFYDKPTKAVPWAKRAVQQAPSSPYTSLVEGICHARAKNTPLARKCFERCLELVPNHRDAQSELEKLGAGGWSLTGGLRRLFGRG